MGVRLLLSCYREANDHAAYCYRLSVHNGLTPATVQAFAAKCFAQRWAHLVAFYTPPVGAKN